MPQPPIDLAKSPDWVFPLLMFCLGVFFATAVVRRGVEVYIPSFAQRNQWKKVWLPSLPVIIGASAAAVMHAYPFLNTLPTWGTRAFYGCVAGGLSSFMYKVFQAVIQAKFGVKVGTSHAPEALDQKSIDTQPAPPPSVSRESDPPTIPPAPKEKP
jgi:hypothetical protein